MQITLQVALGVSPMLAVDRAALSSHISKQSNYGGDAGAARIERGRWLPGILGNVANGDRRASG